MHWSRWGYQAESGPWRAFYLTGAQELRNPRPPSDVPRRGASGTVRSLPVDQLLDSLSVRLNGPKSAGQVISINIAVSDTSETFLLRVENGVLHHHAHPQDDEVDQNVTITRTALVDLVLKERTLEYLIESGEATSTGDASALTRLVDRLDVFDFWFEIVMP